MFLCGVQSPAGRQKAYALLEEAVRRYWKLPALPELARAERGKPYFPAYPAYHFNLSHSGPYLLCALSDRPVGVDVQTVRAAWSPKLVERSCTPAERRWLERWENRPDCFALLWACKESVGKQSGYGLPYPPSRLEIPCLEEGDLCVRPLIWGGRYLRGYVGPGWRGAVCAWEEPPADILWLEL